jgi:hypothetical protein
VGVSNAAGIVKNNSIPLSQRLMEMAGYGRILATTHMINARKQDKKSDKEEIIRLDTTYDQQRIINNPFHVGDTDDKFYIPLYLQGLG